MILFIHRNKLVTKNTRMEGCVFFEIVLVNVLLCRIPFYRIIEHGKSKSVVEIEIKVLAHKIKKTKQNCLTFKNFKTSISLLIQLFYYRSFQEFQN
jgi:hypothetical protein